MILREHAGYYNDLFALPDVVASPVLCIGYQDVEPGAVVRGIQADNLQSLLAAMGMEASSLDLFDPRAALRYDLNAPVPASEHGRFQTILDIGSLEHVFDTRQCLDNCLRMVAPGGHYLLHTPVHGFYEHGLHVFNPAALIGALELNGFHIVYQKFSEADGAPVVDPADGGNVLLWLAARKRTQVETFQCPQQDMWPTLYARPQAGKRRLEVITMPRTCVELSMYLTYGHAAGCYEWSVRAGGRRPVVSGATETQERDGVLLLEMPVDLSGVAAGDYVFAMKHAAEDWQYIPFRVLQHYPMSCWKKS
jgi:hypothetical protein